MTQIAKTVLMIDDDRDDRLLFEDAFSKVCSIIFRGADNCPEGHHLLLQGLYPDLIVLDINMPFQNGRECLVALRRKDWLTKVVIVMYSTSFHQDDVDFCMANGANYYFKKPDNFNGVVEIVRALCLEIIGAEP